MAESNSVHGKRSRGRPATGQDPLISFRAPKALVDKITAEAKHRQMSRSDFVRGVLQIGLNHIDTKD